MINPKIVVVDYGLGNTYSVSNAINSLGYKKISISDQESTIKEADALILPGVGAFEACIMNLKERKLDVILNEEVLVKKKPILGICVGMQLMASASEENGIHEGLDWIEGRVIKLELPAKFAVPHVGWNNVTFNTIDPLFNRNADKTNFYFDHSYFFKCAEKYITATCDYGIKVTAAVQHENIFGVQFHPEKSQSSGLKLFRSFFNSLK